MLYKTEFRQLNNDLFWNFCKSIEIDKGTVAILIQIILLLGCLTKIQVLRYRI